VISDSLEPKLQDHGHGASVRTVCLFTPPAYDGTKYTAWRQMLCVNDLSKVALDSAEAGIEPHNRYTIEPLKKIIRLPNFQQDALN